MKCEEIFYLLKPIPKSFYSRKYKNDETTFKQFVESLEKVYYKK